MTQHELTDYASGDDAAVQDEDDLRDSRFVPDDIRGEDG